MVGVLLWQRWLESSTSRASSEPTAEDFCAINPNLDCDNLFVGQWLCVAGSA
ncbi:hypothetical protein ACLOJK_021353 [Asimina triloba]